MKHLLIILSILLLSSPLIGNSHKGETLYAWGECCDWVWKGFGDKETHSVYKGQVKDGKPEGIGILIYKDGRKYEGNWKNGIWNGRGKYTFKDRTTFYQVITIRYSASKGCDMSKDGLPPRLHHPLNIDNN